jgi:hypothetical protein
MYNSDKSNFMMGMVSTEAVITGSDRWGRLKGIQEGNRE